MFPPHDGGGTLFWPPPLFNNGGGGNIPAFAQTMVVILIWSPPMMGGADLRKKIRPPPSWGGGVLAKWGVPKNVIFLAVPPHDGGGTAKKIGFFSRKWGFGKIASFFSPIMGGGKILAPHLTAHFFLLFAFPQILPHIFFWFAFAKPYRTFFLTAPPPTMEGTSPMSKTIQFYLGLVRRFHCKTINPFWTQNPSKCWVPRWIFFENLKDWSRDQVAPVVENCSNFYLAKL